MESLDNLLDEVSVLYPGDWTNDEGPKTWYAVADESGIIAYFGTQQRAFWFRLAYINDRLNDLKAKE